MLDGLLPNRMLPEMIDKYYTKMIMPLAVTTAAKVIVSEPPSMKAHLLTLGIAVLHFFYHLSTQVSLSLIFVVPALKKNLFISPFAVLS
jgi:hypothetical protein